MQRFELNLIEMIEMQRKKVLKVAEQLVPCITEEDILQPNDFPILESHPFFRYEEGVLEGLISALASFRAAEKEKGILA